MDEVRRKADAKIISEKKASDMAVLKDKISAEKNSEKERDKANIAREKERIAYKAEVRFLTWLDKVGWIALLYGSQC